MTKEQIGLLSGVLVAMSVMPYIYRVWRGEIHPNVTGWILWSVIGLSLLLTYRSSGAEANAWPALFGFVNPTTVTVLVIWQHGKLTWPDRVEWVCVFLCLLSLVLWWYVKSDKTLAQYALYVSLVADLFAVWPTIRWVWEDPERDRPFAWIAFSLAYLLGIFAIPENTLSNWSLPIYMGITGTTIALPLLYRRLVRRAPWYEWI